MINSNSLDEKTRTNYNIINNNYYNFDKKKVILNNQIKYKFLK